MDISAVCRTCLKTDKKSKSLFKSGAADLLIHCKFWEVHENDGFPNQICEQCDSLLHKSYKFKQLCDQSRLALESYLYKSQSVQCNISSSIPAIEENVTNDNAIFETREQVENDFVSERKVEKFPAADYTREHEILHSEIEVDSKPKIMKLQELELNIKEEHESLENSTALLKDNTGDDLTSFLEVPPAAPLPYSCKVCSESFETESDFILHQSTHTTGKFVCIACDKIFSNRQMLKRHIKIHMKVKPHICGKCGKGFAESHALTKHMRRHYGIPREKKHVCSECGQGYSEPFYLRVHMRKHTGERPLVCTVCEKSFADPRSLKTHSMTHTGEKPYKCDLCSKAFSQKANLMKHVRVHTGEKPYICESCGKTFTQPSSLDKHYRIHTGEKPYKCSACPRSFAEKGALVTHHRTHTGEKPYVCTACGKAYARSSELKLHFHRTHEGNEMKHVCDICLRGFATPSYLIIHKRSHTGERPFSCTLCSKSFAEKGSLKKHIKLHDETIEISPL